MVIVTKAHLKKQCAFLLTVFGISYIVTVVIASYGIGISSDAIQLIIINYEQYN